MAITDELREWATGLFNTRKTVLDIADRIDAAHEEALASSYFDGVFSDGELAENGFIRLPVDADGEYIRIGDMMDTEHFGTVEVEGFVHNSIAFYNYSGQPAYLCTSPVTLCRHHHAPTVEDVLHEFALACEDAGNAGPEVARIAAEYAAKLRLAGMEDE